MGTIVAVHGKDYSRLRSTDGDHRRTHCDDELVSTSDRNVHVPELALLAS